MSRNLKRTLLIIAVVSATPFFATAAVRAKIMEAVGLTSTHRTACTVGAAADQATPNGLCSPAQENATQHVSNPGKNRPLQFNFRRY